MLPASKGRMTTMRNGLASKALIALTVLGTLLAGCGGSDTSGSAGGGGTTTTTTDSGGTGGTGGATGGTGGATSSGGTGGDTGGAASPEFVAHTDPAKGELVEGLYVDKGSAYIGLAPLGTIKKVNLTGGAVTDFGAIPPIPANGGFLLGIVVDAAGNAYVGFGGGPGVDVKNGVYKIPAAGGSVADPFATDAAMNFPNGLLLDGTDLFVADSGGTIFKIAANGAVSPWITDPSLVGTDQSCMFAAPFPIGANGIVKIGSAFYVANTNLAQIVKIAINADGTAGAASVFAGPDCNALGAIDGLAVDADGTSLLGVLNAQNKLVRIDSAGAITDVFAGAPLDNPASIVVEKDASGATAYITNSSFFNQATPAPGLLAYPLQ